MHVCMHECILNVCLHVGMFAFASVICVFVLSIDCTLTMYVRMYVRTYLCFVWERKVVFCQYC